MQIGKITQVMGPVVDVEFAYELIHFTGFFRIHLRKKELHQSLIIFVIVPIIIFISMVVRRTIKSTLFTILLISIVPSTIGNILIVSVKKLHHINSRTIKIIIFTRRNITSTPSKVAFKSFFNRSIIYFYFTLIKSFIVFQLCNFNYIITAIIPKDKS